MFINIPDQTWYERVGKWLKFFKFNFFYFWLLKLRKLTPSFPADEFVKLITCWQSDGRELVKYST
jgi:hypothetical protein